VKFACDLGMSVNHKAQQEMNPRKYRLRLRRSMLLVHRISITPPLGQVGQDLALRIA